MLTSAGEQVHMRAGIVVDYSFVKSYSRGDKGMGEMRTGGERGRLREAEGGRRQRCRWNGCG